MIATRSRSRGVRSAVRPLTVATRTEYARHEPRRPSQCRPKPAIRSRIGIAGAVPIRSPRYRGGMAETQREPVPRVDSGELDMALAFLSFARHCVLKKAAWVRRCMGCSHADCDLDALRVAVEVRRSHEPIRRAVAKLAQAVVATSI